MNNVSASNQLAPLPFNYNEDEFALEVASDIISDIQRELESFGDESSLLLTDAYFSYSPDAVNEYVDEDTDSDIEENYEPFVNFIDIHCRVEQLDPYSILVQGGKEYQPLDLTYSAEPLHQYLCSTYRHVMSFIGEVYIVCD